MTFVFIRVTFIVRHGRIGATKEKDYGNGMRSLTERQDASDGTGITCLSHSLNARHLG